MIRRGAHHQQMPIVHIADGFYDDCDELINRCSQLSTVDYQSFTQIWKDMNLGFIYQGRVSGPEVAELTEEVLLIAKHYMIRDTVNFEETVAGLFLVYGLLTLQPYAGFAWLRIVPEDVPALQRIEMVARREKRSDVLYILGDILIKRTQYHAVERERGMERQLRKYIEGSTSVDRLGIRPKGVFYRQNEEMDIIRELGSITRQYVRAKTNLTENGANASLRYIDETLSDDLNASLKKIINGFVDNHDGNDDSSDDSEPEHYDSVQTIKRKAMENAVEPMKHLTRIEERKTTKTSPQNSDLKTATGKIKRGSPKPVATSPLKRSRKTPSPKKKRPKKTLWPISDLETNEPEKPPLDESNSEGELNLTEFHKEKTFHDVGSKNVVVNQETGEIIPEGPATDLDLQDIEIESLPVIIRTGKHGQSFEIEIIDEYKGDGITQSENSENTDKEENSDNVKSTSSKTCEDSTELRKKDKDETNDKTVNKKSMGRYHHKRGNIQTKFKKMGMLPIANFDDTKPSPKLK